MDHPEPHWHLLTVDFGTREASGEKTPRFWFWLEPPSLAHHTAPCWIGEDQMREQWPQEVGIYRIRPAADTEYPGFGDGDDDSGLLEIEVLGADTTWTPWQPTPKPYQALALWTPDGALDRAVPTKDVEPDDRWTMMINLFPDEPMQQRRSDGWQVDGLTEQDRQLLVAYRGFRNPGSRADFLTERMQAAMRKAAGQPEPHSYAAWSTNGTLIAYHPKQPGLNGPQSLGIGEPNELTVDALDAEQHAALRNSHLYARPGGRDDFLATIAAQSAEQQIGDPEPSTLARALAEAVNRHGAECEAGGTPDIVLGQYLEECLHSFGRALVYRGALEGAGR